MGGPDLAELLHEAAAVPAPPSRLDSAALYAAGRRRRRAVTVVRAAAVAGALAAVLLAGTAVVGGLNHRVADPLAMPGAAYLAGLPAVADQPGDACRVRVVSAALTLADRLPTEAVWTPGYSKDCRSPYVRMTARTSQAIYWVVLMTVPGAPLRSDPCTQTGCRQTDLGRLTWGTGMGVGLYRDPPGQTGVGLTYATLDRTRDGLQIQVFEWLTYPSARRAPPMPHSPQVLSDALLAAARRW